MEFIDRLLHHVTILIGIAVDGEGKMKVNFSEKIIFEEWPRKKFNIQLDKWKNCSIKMTAMTKQNRVFDPKINPEKLFFCISGRTFF